MILISLIYITVSYNLHIDGVAKSRIYPEQPGFLFIAHLRKEKLEGKDLTRRVESLRCSMHGMQGSLPSWFWEK